MVTLWWNQLQALSQSDSPESLVSLQPQEGAQVPTKTACVYLLGMY